VPKYFMSEINMKKKSKKQAASKPGPVPQELKGWQQIATFLGEPTSVVQRWANEGMPVHKEGRFVSTTPDQLNEWMAQQTGKPVHVATESTDLTAELKTRPVVCAENREVNFNHEVNSRFLTATSCRFGMTSARKRIWSG
jgi:hypothetical protein